MNISSFITSLRVCGWLLWFDIRLVFKDFFNNMIDASTWPFFIIFINGYILPTLGMPLNYGAFTTVSMVAIVGAYKAWGESIHIASDLAGAQTISYELTLPISYWMVWIKYGLSLTIKAGAFNIMPLVIGKLLLGNLFDLSHFSVGKFALIYAMSSLFFGFFGLWSTVITSSPENHARLELRLVGPMFFLNGFASSWAAMYAISPALGIFVRCLPWIYAYEGSRAAILGQEGFINFWVCIGMLFIFTFLLGIMSVLLFKKRMDCV